jgi:hypothetical protein
MDDSMTRWEMRWKQMTDPVFRLCCRPKRGSLRGRRLGGPLVSFDRSKYAGNDDADDNANINSNVNANFNDNVITMTKPTSMATSMIL